jgi:hypothetical protein
VRRKDYAEQSTSQTPRFEVLQVGGLRQLAPVEDCGDGGSGLCSWLLSTHGIIPVYPPDGCADEEGLGYSFFDSSLLL